MVTRIEGRAEFERRRNCSHCGRRLVFSQYEQSWPEPMQVVSKRCPLYGQEPMHDMLEHEHRYPYRDKHGQVSDGTRRALRS
jgi:hypothetical protein